MLHDETTGRDEKPVQVGRKNITLRLDTERRGPGFDLPIARMMRDGSGHFIFDPDFIPPCVEISASERVMSMLGRLIEILEDKSSRFARSRGGEVVGGILDPRNRQFLAAAYGQLGARSAAASLSDTKQAIPKHCIVEMLKLGGALCTFAIESHPRDLPLYDHRNLAKCFGELDDHIRTHLETIVPTQYIKIPLVKRADYFYEAEVTDQRVLDRARWIFAIRSQVSEPDLIAQTPQLVKLCSKDLRAATGEARAAGNGADASAGAAVGDSREGGFSVFQREPDRPVLGPHCADAANRPVRAGRSARSRSATAGDSGG